MGLKRRRHIVNRPCWLDFTCYRALYPLRYQIFILFPFFCRRLWVFAHRFVCALLFICTGELQIIFEVRVIKLPSPLNVILGLLNWALQKVKTVGFQEPLHEDLTISEGSFPSKLHWKVSGNHDPSVDRHLLSIRCLPPLSKMSVTPHCVNYLRQISQYNPSISAAYRWRVQFLEQKVRLVIEKRPAAGPQPKPQRPSGAA